MSRSFWRDRRVLVTGNTGFKGSWLSLWLRQLGAEVYGLSLGVPTTPSLYEMMGLNTEIRTSLVDIGDFSSTERCFVDSAPEIVVHLAAQSLVRNSYRDPLETYRTNVLGTANVLEAVRRAGSVQCVVIATSDKVYQPTSRPHAEGDPLGGPDPYSSSKAGAELVVDAYRSSFFQDSSVPNIATVRAGNVIGGGDWATERLIPDLIGSIFGNRELTLRHPNAIRPWQHVLDCLHGYLMLAERLAADETLAGPWNFGPDPDDARSVSWIVDALTSSLGASASWTIDSGETTMPESPHLEVDSSKAREFLGWVPRWSVEDAVARTADWHRQVQNGSDPRRVTDAQIHEFAASV